ncbi:MAG: putative toxin-antitoxin system toxin component, PIN family [Proteobacteria bacterium]|nr:putative toxin-antitoxin system toxin component, PIN family [Pseudomonadota bacterium]
MRVVLDTNVLVSGVISGNGPPRRLLDAAKAGVFELCTSEALLAEMLDVLSRDKFAARLRQAGLTPDGIVDDLRRIAIIVSPQAVPRVVASDTDDDQVIATAIAGRAELIASGDKRDLLPMGSHAGIPIITAREALERVEARHKP